MSASDLIDRHAEILAEGRRLFKAMGVQPGKAEYHVFPDRHSIVRVITSETGAQHLLDEPEEEIGEFFAWVINHFDILVGK